MNLIIVTEDLFDELPNERKVIFQKGLLRSSGYLSKISTKDTVFFTVSSEPTIPEINKPNSIIISALSAYEMLTSNKIRFFDQLMADCNITSIFVSTDTSTQTGAFRVYYLEIPVAKYKEELDSALNVWLPTAIVTESTEEIPFDLGLEIKADEALALVVETIKGGVKPDIYDAIVNAYICLDNIETYNHGSRIRRLTETYLGGDS